jgi:YgiT-type zinc finger domain-containing protein
MSDKYSDCRCCGGKVTERLIEREYRWKGKFYIFENAPIGVCTQCGEKYIKASVAKKMEEKVLKHPRPDKRLAVPVYSYN